MLTKRMIQSLPQAPGVYYFRDVRGRILYIGKAKRIRDRVRQHIAAGYEGLKADFIARSARVTYRVTETPMEAAIREGEEIKKHKPPYNVAWKDNKNFFFIGITHESEPQIFITHQPRRGVTIFGPFVEKQPVEEIMRALRIVFGVKRNRMIRRARGWRVTGERWQEVVRETRVFFRRGVGMLMKNAECAMRSAAVKQDFERAAYFRDKVSRLERFRQAQKIARAFAQEIAPLDALYELARALGLERIPEKIEGYDISNIQGEQATASLVVALQGVMAKTEYRRFKIKTVRGANDVAMMRETIARRLAHGKRGARQHWPWPDLMLVDGGKPQVRAAVDALAIAGVRIPVVGIAKSDERLVTLKNGKWQEARVSRRSAGLQLLQRVRDEAHRFARAYHLALRRKSATGGHQVSQPADRLFYHGRKR